MSDELIKRIDAWFKNIPSTNDTWHLLADCKTEIERLLLANETLRGWCEDYQAQIKVMEQAREYVPMTGDEWLALWKSSNEYNYALNIESEVVKRAGLIVKEKE